MKLVWVNSVSTAAQKQIPGSHIIKHARQIEHHGKTRARARQDTKKESLKSRRSGTLVIFGSDSDDTVQEDDQAAVTQSEDGSTFFLITRQEDFSEKPKPVIRQCLDSWMNPVATLDGSQKEAMSYVSTAWLPTASGLQPNRCFGCLSLVWPGDEQVAITFLNPALQAAQDRSLYTLLAAASRKMQIDGRMPQARDSTAALFSYKAVQALRRTLSGSDTVDDQLVLDLTFLVLAEIYAKSPQHVSGIDTYWKMVSDYIASLGGFLYIRSIVTFFVTSIDILCTLSGMTGPSLDPAVRPQLLGLDAPGLWSSTAEVDFAAADADFANTVAPLTPRCQISIKCLRTLGHFTELIRALPGGALEQFQAFLLSNLRTVVTTIICPLSMPEKSAAPGIEDAVDARQADTAHFLARLWGIIMAWWYIAITFVPEADRASLKTPQLIKFATSQAWHYLDETQMVVGHRKWYITPNVAFWISAVGCLVAQDVHDWRECRRLLVYFAAQKGIKSEADVSRILAPYAPLQRVNATYIQSIWFLLEEATTESSSTTGTSPSYPTPTSIR